MVAAVVVAVLVDVVEDLLIRKAELLLDVVVDASVGLMHQHHVDVVQREPVSLQYLE